MSVLQSLYDSEINFSVDTMWDCGFHVALGDELNGYKAETTVSSWAEVESWLLQQALHFYPESDFAKRMNRWFKPDRLVDQPDPNSVH